MEKKEHRLDSTTTDITTALFKLPDNVIVLSDLVESSGYSSKTLQKGSCPYAPLDEVLRYVGYWLPLAITKKHPLIIRAFSGNLNKTMAKKYPLSRENGNTHAAL